MNGKDSKPRQLKLSESAKQLGRSAVGVSPEKRWRLEWLLQSPEEDWLTWCHDLAHQEDSEGYM